MDKTRIASGMIRTRGRLAAIEVANAEALASALQANRRRPGASTAAASCCQRDRKRTAHAAR
jgi:hypothetical protein